MSIAKRIINLREEKQLKQYELAEKLKMNPVVLNRIEKGTRPVRDEEILAISRYFNVSADYLLGKSNLRLSNEIQAPYETKKVPIIGTVKCGADGFAYEYMDGYVMIDDSIHGDIRAFHCKGDSMTGVGINDGDIAIVRIQDDIENGEIAVVVINGDEGTLKRVRKQDNVIILEAANQNYPSRIFSGHAANTVHIVGKVIEVRKKF